jgi:hypothetical protein
MTWRNLNPAGIGNDYRSILVSGCATLEFVEGEKEELFGGLFLLPGEKALEICMPFFLVGRGGTS